MAKLKSPGAVSVGGELYEQAEDGTVDVPDEHAAHLVESHGCEYVQEKRGRKSKRDDEGGEGGGENKGDAGQ